MRLSFRTRLIIAFVALFAAISVVVSFAGLMLREQQIRGLFDRELMTRAQGVTDALNALPDLNDANIQETINHISRQVYFHDFYIQVYNSKSQPIAKSATLGRGQLFLRRPFEDRSADNSIIERAVTTATFPDGGPASLRGIRLRFKKGSGNSYLVLVATDPRYINDSVASLRTLFIGGNLGGLVAAAGAAWLVTGAMARRIETLKTQVQTLGPDDIARRIVMREHDEISELATHLNAMLDRLKAGFETQERFIHDASHELKTPVATVQAEAQAILLGDPSQQELLEFVNNTNDEMRRLGRLTEALLLLTRANDSYVASRFRVMDLTEITIASIRHLSTMATDHQVRLQLEHGEPADESVLVRCDGDLVEAMISNLIRNAIRFSPRNAQIKIHVRSGAGIAEVAVEDEGPGIPQDVLPRIFDRYFQSSQAKVRRGAGLGLAIASTVVHLHGGSISAANQPTHGAVFTVRLPLLNPTPKTA